MATRCRSARCAAERRGARRELETWRHKLIACVGFESILEGIYGPRLLQDLSIFEDCEPDAISDWSTEACCPFCNLQLEKLTEHVPVSPPPAETPPPQGLSTSEKLQCQANQFLHAVFRKKEFPEFCDPTIPLAAQELMRKMIRQFAIEYACKSQPESPEGHNMSQADFPKNAEPDGPLDLTISRVTHCPDVAISSVTHCPEQDGVLDLSKKNTSSLKVLNNENISGSLVPADEDQCRMEEEKEEAEHWRGTVLEKVLSLLCSDHRLLLYQILQDMQKDYSVALALRDAQRLRAKTEPYCCPAERKSSGDLLPCSLNQCTAVGCASCLATCGACTVTSICICLKTLSNLACQNHPVECVGKVICPSSTVCCALQKILACPHQCNSETVCMAHSKNLLGVHVNHHKHVNSLSTFQSCCSPSPPPLSPVPVDAESKMGDKHIGCKGQEHAVLSKPCLLPHQTEGEDDDKAARSDAQHSEGSPTAPVKNAQAMTEETENNSSFLGDLMDKFTEKLKNIQPAEKEQTPQTTPAVQNSACDDTHLTEIITTVLHSSSDTEYNLSDLFEKRVAAEQHSPQTHSRRRREVLAAMSKSPDLADSQRQSLQIKCNLARVDPACRRKLGLGSSKCPKNVQPNLPSLFSELMDVEPTKEPNIGEHSRLTSESKQEGKEKPADLPDIPLRNENEIPETEFPTGKSHQDKSETSQPNCKVERSRRNIVPPQRFSSYVTEPRKMYYTACFSERIFIKHSPNGNTNDSAEITHISAETPVKTEDQVIHSLEDEIFSSTKIRTGENENVEKCCSKQSRRTERLENFTSPAKRLKLCDVKSLEESQSSGLNLGHSTDIDSLNETKDFNLKYASPIKLMLVSPVKGENGVKYTLKAADSGSNPHGEMFDPCIEASWAGSVINEQTPDKNVQIDSVQDIELVDNHTKLPDVVVSTDDLIDQENSVHETLTAIREITPVKRRPGRPKKLGPQIEKAVKRPIGRPPKARTVDMDSLSGKNVSDQTTNEKSVNEDGNKNLKITIMYGRSRKARRVVSEDLPHSSVNQHTYEVHDSSTSNDTKNMNVGGDSILNVAKNQLEDLHFVMPMEDRKSFVCASSNIKCQKQSDLAATRKPGRPPKVKISGISVTVTTVSPRQRKIHMRRDMKESPPQKRALLMEFEPSKDQKTIDERYNGVRKDGVGLGTSFVPVRHSVRERKPSIHLLHSVATARPCSRNGVPVLHKPHKLLINNGETDHQTNHHSPDVAANNAPSGKTSKVNRMRSAVRFSGASVDSIFASDERLKWWPITASPETLNGELARRIRLMSDTWVSDVLEAKKTAEKNLKPKNDVSAKRSSSVKMLFERNYNMEKLCSWFMQTTETQSLAIVKKASAKNPYEIFHYNSMRPTCRDNVCHSPQAERLRKHVKKFAKIVPSPKMHRQAQAMLYCTGRSFANRCLFSTSHINLMHADGQKISRSCGTWGVYRAALFRARTKFRTRTKKTLPTEQQCKTHPEHLISSIKTTGLSKELLNSLNQMQDTHSESQIPKVEALEKTSVTGISIEESIDSKAWSPEKLKECRVFLKKINSPNTKAATEECNVCKVKINTSPAKCDVSMRQEEQKSNETAKLEKKKHRCSVSLLPPAKVTRQSRSSRGVLGSRWSDFVLGPSK